MRRRRSVVRARSTDRPLRRRVRGDLGVCFHGPGDESGRSLARTAVCLAGAGEDHGAVREQPVPARRPAVDYPALLGRVRGAPERTDGRSPAGMDDLLDSLAPCQPAAVGLLSRPSARRIVGIVNQSPGGLTVGEIAAALGLHHTTLRPQLAALERTGVMEARIDAAAGPGRPPARWVLKPRPAAREAVGHRALVRLLVSHARSMGFRAEEVERLGAGQGAAMVEPGRGLPEIVRVLERLGFRPRHGAADEIGDLILRRCPFATADGGPAHDIVCRMHRGLVKGMVQVTAPDIELCDFGVRDAGGTTCRMRFAAAPLGAEPRGRDA